MSGRGEGYPRDRVTLREVGLRDGLQMVRAWPATEAKKEWIRREHAAGVRHFELGSFLPVRTMPQFADLRELIDFAAGLEGLRSAALALNDRGAEDAAGSGIDEIVCVVSATEEHSQANARRSRDEAVALIGRAAALARDATPPKLVYAGVAMAFGCSIAGRVAEDDVIRIAERCLEAGAEVVGLADTVGFAGPRHVGSLCARMERLCGGAPFGIHLHDTRGLGLANASAALDAGARVIDGSLGGLGGCPFAPGATGNIVFEDLVFLCETKGFATNVDLHGVLAAREVAAAGMPGEAFFGAIARAGPPPTLDWRA